MNGGFRGLRRTFIITRKWPFDLYPSPSIPLPQGARKVGEKERVRGK
jgi:hypothetical protein